MQKHAFQHAGARRCVAVLAPSAVAVLTVLLSGCAATRPDPQAEVAAGRALAVGDALVFRTEGGPLDEPPTGEADATLTLEEAVRQGVTTDPGLQAALARVRIAMAEADQARLLPNPVLNIVLRWGPGRPQIEASLTQDLIQVLQIRRRASAADNRLRQAAADAVTEALDVSAELQERYAEVQASDALVPLLEERLILVRRLAETAKARLQSGEGTSTESTILDAQRVELEVEIDAAKIEQREGRIRLARLLGEPSSGAAWRLEPWSAPTIAGEPESRWVEVALVNRPEVQAIAWQLAALGDDYALARLLPWEGAGAGIEAQRDDDWFVGPSISTPIPIFDMGQARKARVTAEQVEARHSLTLARRKVVEEVRVAYQTLIASRANLQRIRNELIPLQQRRRQVTEDVYKVERDITPLLLAEQDLRTAQARAIDVERQAALALVRLQRAVGGAGVQVLSSETTPPVAPAQPSSPSASISKVSHANDAAPSASPISKR